MENARRFDGVVEGSSGWRDEISKNEAGDQEECRGRTEDWFKGPRTSEQISGRGVVGGSQQGDVACDGWRKMREQVGPRASMRSPTSHTSRCVGVSRFARCSLIGRPGLENGWAVSQLHRASRIQGGTRRARALRPNLAALGRVYRVWVAIFVRRNGTFSRQSPRIVMQTTLHQASTLPMLPRPGNRFDPGERPRMPHSSPDQIELTVVGGVHIAVGKDAAVFLERATVL